MKLVKERSRYLKISRLGGMSMEELKTPQSNSQRKIDTPVREKAHPKVQYKQYLIKLYGEHLKRTGEVDYFPLIDLLKKFAIQFPEQTQKPVEYRQHLIQIYIEYIKRTGKIDYPTLVEILKQAYSLNKLPKQIETLKIELHTLEQASAEIVFSAIALQQILKCLVNQLRPTNSEGLFRDFNEQLHKSDRDLSLTTNLKTELYKIATNIEIVLNLAEKYNSSPKKATELPFKHY
jgi:hypothetical protein